MNLSKKQYTFKKTLEDIAHILNKHNIEFFLVCGTALGAHREGKFIEHDKDIDIGIFSHNHDISFVVKKILESNIFNLYKHYPETEKEITRNTGEVTLIHNKTKIHVDIFNIIKYNTKYIRYTYGSICENKPGGRCEYIFPVILETILFMGNEYLIPGINYIESEYGPSWKKPRKYTYEEGIKYNLYKSLI
tara:strand:- start:12397 stop:12969 length:573 start_codon:yes stop_codon:yes gene_type:complete